MRTGPRLQLSEMKINTEHSDAPRVGDLIVLSSIGVPALVISQFECISTRFLILWGQGDYCAYTWRYGFLWKLRAR